MWRSVKGRYGAAVDALTNAISSNKKKVENSAVYFVLSPEWKAAVTEREKVYLFVFSLLYLGGFLIFSYALIVDVTMVNSLQLKAFVNTQAEVPILQKVNLNAKVIFTTGIWHKGAEMVVKPNKGSGGYVGSYPLIHEKLFEAHSLYDDCLVTNFRTTPVLTASLLNLVVGSVIFVSAGPLVILSRRAFYNCAMVGSLLLASCVLLNRAAYTLLLDCLRRLQAVQVDNKGNYVENLRGSTLFDVAPLMEQATTATIWLYLTILGFLPLILMGGLAERILGRPV